MASRSGGGASHLFVFRMLKCARNDDFGRLGHFLVRNDLREKGVEREEAGAEDSQATNA